MDCFENLIGVGGECEPSKSGLTLEDIGLHPGELNDFVGSYYKTGVNLGQKKIESATRLVVSDLEGALNTNITTNKVLESAQIGFLKEDSKKLASHFMGGIELEICNTRNYVDIYLSSITLNVCYTGIIELYVYNVINKEIVKTIEFNSVECQPLEVNVDELISGFSNKLHLMLLYDTRLANQSTFTEVKKGGCKSCDGGLMTRTSEYIKARGISLENNVIIDGKYYDPLLNESDCPTLVPTSQRHTYGLSLKYSVQCSFSNWLCSFKNLLLLPIVYKAGTEVLKHALFVSTRMNSKTTIDKKSLQMRLAEYDSLYKKELKKLAASVKVPSGRCFDCKSLTKTTVTLP